MDFREGEYEIYEPEWGLTKKPINEIFDVTRASGETILTPTGRIATVGPDTLPLEYVPETGGLGAQIYGEVTNLLQYSQDFTVSGRPWTFIGSAGTATDTGAPAPLDTGATWWDVIAASGASGVRIEQVIADIGEGEWTMHAVVDRLEFDEVRLIAVHIRDIGSNTSTARFNISSGEVVSSSGDISEARIKKLQQGYLISASFSTDSSATSIRQRLELFGSSSDEGDGESGVKVAAMWMTRGQFEAPYQLTTDSTVTKPATNVARGLGEEFNRGEFTLLLDIGQFVRVPGTNTALLTIQDIVAQNSECLRVFSGADDRLDIQLRSLGGNLFTTQFINRTTGRFALSFKEGQFSWASTDNSGTETWASGFPNFSNGVVMEVANNTGTGAISRSPALIGSEIKAVPRALEETELIEWTRGGS